MLDDELEGETRCADRLDARCEESALRNDGDADALDALTTTASGGSKGNVVELKNRLSSSSLALDVFQTPVSSSNAELTSVLGFNR